MARRVWVLLRARLASRRGDECVPIAALLVHAFLATLVCGLVRNEVPAFAYALIALTASAALIAVPLLGELASLLHSDETGDWIRGQPIRPLELHLARTLHLCIALGVLSLGALVPAGLAAGSDFGTLERVQLVAAGLCQALAIAAVLLCVQAALRGRAQALLVVFQTALLVAVVVGSTVGLRHVRSMRDWVGPDIAEGLLLYPPAWFAAGLAPGVLHGAWSWLAPAVTALAALTVLASPAPPIVHARRGQPLLGALLAPLRRAAARWWVRRDERASFEWLFDALPKERDFVLRTYPLLAVPVGLMWIGARAGDAREHAHWLEMLMFVPGAYLPLLAAHVPASTSHKARWIVDSAPIARDALDRGAIKAIAVRILVPFFALLLALSALLGGAALAARLVLPAWLACIVVLRATWRLVVTAPPQSTSPDELYVNRDWIGMLAVLALVLCATAIAAARYVDNVWKACVFAAAMIAIEVLSECRARRAAAH